MRITERHLDRALVLELQGKLTCPASAGLLELVRRVATGNPPLLVLHLGGVSSIDAAGLGALASAYGIVMASGGTLRLAHVTRRVQALLDLCRLSAVFGTFDSLEAAVAMPGSKRASDLHTGDSRASSQTSFDANGDWRAQGAAVP